MPPDRILEARKTYAELAEASRSLRESAAEVEGSIVALGRQVKQLQDTLDGEHKRVRYLAAEVKSAADDLRWALRRPILLLFAGVILGGFLGAVLAATARDFLRWLLEAVLSWWGG